MQSTKPGDRVDAGVGPADIGFGRFRTNIPTTCCRMSAGVPRVSPVVKADAGGPPRPEPP